MKKKNGFTLIELLIVVLIIGILATIALPQYKKSVLKSRLVAMFPYVKAVTSAQERYYLTNSCYANDLKSLDVNITCPNDLNCSINANRIEVYSKENPYISIISKYILSSNSTTRGKMYCWASYNSKSKQLYRDVCKSFGPLLYDNPSGNPAGVSYLIQ